MNRRLAPPHTTRRLWAFLAALMLVAASCSSSGEDSTASGNDASFDEASESVGGDDSGSDGSAEAISPEIAAEGEGDADTGAANPTEDAGGAAHTAGVTAADLNRQIIFTATVQVDVENVASAGNDAVAAIESVGGFVFGQETTGGVEPRSTFVFKVRPADFDRALTALSGIGDLIGQQVSADDVTERVVDLESRIHVAELGVARLSTAMESATTLEDFAELERLLLGRETELEVMRGQIRTLQDQVDLATITLVLTQDRIENGLQLTVTSYEEHNNGLACPGQPENRVEAGTDLTVCFELLNTGDQALTNLTLTDVGLDLDADSELISVFGTLDDTLQPGQSIIVASEIETDRDVRLRSVAGGRPVAIEGEDPAGPPVSITRSATISVTPSDDAPGFGDGFESGRVVLSGIWSAVRVTVGFILPLLILLPFLIGAGWLLRKWRRRPGRKVAAPAPSFGAYTPPPPAPQPVDTPQAATPVDPPD